MSRNHFHDRGKADSIVRSAGAVKAFWLLGLLLLTASFGCVQRRLIVKTQPEGAAVSIDRKPIGYSPVSVPFTYYGTRDVEIEKDGYKPIRVQERVDARWYNRFPISFFTENFSPREIRDQRILDFQLQPKTMTSETELLDRANDLRTNVQRGTIASPVGR